MEIKNLLQNPDVSQRNAAKSLVKKWEKTGLLEGLRTETEVAGMSQLLENQARQLVKEASQTGTANGSEDIFLLKCKIYLPSYPISQAP